MADNFNDRIASLKLQTDDERNGRLRFGSAFFRTFPAFLIIAFLFHSLTAPIIEEGSTADPEQQWQTITNTQFEDRLDWLHATAIISPGGAPLYQWYAETVVSMFHYKRPKKAAAEDLVDLGGIYAGITRAITSLWLRIGFVLIAFWPFWGAAVVAGLTVYRKRFRGKRTDDMLGICDRGSTPFYSGIYGPLRTNNSFSGTDLSCPNLATPQMAAADAAAGHSIGKILKQHGALNQTNLDLTRVILQYRDFPSFVEGEQAAEEVADLGEAVEKTPVSTLGAQVTNANGTIESSAVTGLEAALAAHEALRQYVNEAQERNLSSAQLNASFAAHRELLQKFTANLSPLANTLVSALTPNRAFSLGRIPGSLIASAYLATEAGKCLVYKRDGKSFTRISRYPHLQARAIIQSLVAYGREYNGDTRLVIRQAIICSRRHGDFGRAFLPDRMPVESRALRDWLEILYEEPSRREMVARLVELDAHIEEISLNWRAVYSRRVRQSLDVANLGKKDETSPFWKGLVFKSVVLVPMPEVVGMALRGVDDTRVKRVGELLNLTRKFQTSISISARLPGFKRQAVDREDAALLFASNDPQRDLFDRWVIVRRVLTRYNWLSTRVGDDAVPDEGFVHSLVLKTELDGGKPELAALDMLVPIRQRRYDEMFGKSWEGAFFVDSPHPNHIRVYVDRDEYQQAMKREQENLKKLTPITSANKAASA